MIKSKLYDSLDGLFAYDTGCVDSGIKDEVLRQEVLKTLNDLSEDRFRIVISEYIRDMFLSPKALKQGYGIEDVKSFINWLSDRMRIYI